jgi:hypothetical protein
MKEQSAALPQFSGYPLKIAQSNQKLLYAIKLKAVKKETSYSSTSNQKNNITNDPQYWDESWFGNYE